MTNQTSGEIFSLQDLLNDCDDFKPIFQHENQNLIPVYDSFQNEYEFQGYPNLFDEYKFGELNEFKLEEDIKDNEIFPDDRKCFYSEYNNCIFHGNAENNPILGSKELPKINSYKPTVLPISDNTPKNEIFNEAKEFMMRSYDMIEYFGAKIIKVLQSPINKKNDELISKPEESSANHKPKKIFVCKRTKAIRKNKHKEENMKSSKLIGKPIFRCEKV